MIQKCPSSTKETKILYRALQKRNIEPILEYWDGYKHIDMCIEEAKLFIEVDGLQHKYNYNQINEDLDRDYYSKKEGFKTLRFKNKDIKDNLEIIVDKIINEIDERII